MMSVHEGYVVSYNPEFFPRTNAAPNKRPVGMASSIMAQEYAFHLALAAMDVAMAVQKGKRGKKIPIYFLQYWS